MKTADIIHGIHTAQTVDEISAHLNNVSNAIDRGECNYENEEWLEIESAMHLQNEVLGIMEMA